jgi:hypothetical protein
MGDNGIGKGDVATGAMAYVIYVFCSIAIYNVIELTFILWTTFKRRGGLYWWSFNVATYGIAIYSVGFILMNSVPYWQSWLYATCVSVGWPMMVTGQSMVLYSRLHLVLLDRRILRAVLWMIIIDAIIAHVPTIVFIYGANIAGKWTNAYSAYEKVQVTIFFIQECIISALYISETMKTIKLQRELRNTKSSQRLLKHLIFINILIIAFDITILGLEYASYYDVQTTYKAMVYAAKLKLEFSILNKLVEATTAQKELSGSSHLSTSGANAIGFPLEVDDDDGIRERRRPGLTYRASIRGGQDARSSSSAEIRAPPSIHNGVFLTREVEVKTEERMEGDCESMLELREWTASGGDGSSTGVIPMEDIEQALKSCSQVHLAPETWPHDEK